MAATAAIAASEGRRILVAVDEGEESMYALSWCLKNVVPAYPAAAAAAAAVPEEEGGGDSKDTLILLHARASRVVYGSMDGTGYLFSADILASMEQHSKEAAAAVIAKAKNLCAQNPNIVKVETRVLNGDPREAICETVEKLGADMLVMGSHGYGLVKRTFLGSVSNYCAQNVQCPVLIVKRPKH